MFTPRPISRLAALTVLAVTLVTAACGSDADRSTGPNETHSIAGSWAGSAVLGQVRFAATFQQNGEAVTGTGDFTSPLGSGPFEIAGEVRGDSVELTLASSQFGAGIYRGRFTSADRISGSLDAPNFSDLQLTLERQ